MRRLFCCTCLTPVVVILPIAAAHAETKIENARTAAISTATVNSGAADDISITSAGSVKPSAGAAVTMNSNNHVTNAGAIQITGASGAAGIAMTAGTIGNVTNSGTIIIDENYTATDGDNDGDIDGPFAQGSGRYGIRALGAHNGSISSSGTITIEGNASAGIALDGPLTGSVSKGGTISVVGNNSYGLRTGDVSGNVSITGSTAVQGEGSVGAAMLGDVGGSLKVQGAIIATGYRNTTAPSDTAKLDADDLLQGGSALVVAGNVSGGIILDAPPANTDDKSDDDDKDGVKDSEEGTASVTSYGSAAAMRVGSADEAILIAAVPGNTNGMGLVINGSVSGVGVYKGVDGNALLIGGLGGDVRIAGGVSVNGAVRAISVDRNATAFRIGGGATVPEIISSGSIGATTGGAEGYGAIALQIDAGATIYRITNSGSISASATAEKGTATAVLDRSGAMTSLVNQGSITATAVTGANAAAIDLSANTTGLTLVQSRASNTAALPSIVGAVKLGSGNDSISASAGSIAGDIYFGDGNDGFALSGTATFSGTAAFGAGNASLTLSDTAALTGAISGSGSIDVQVNGGKLNLTGMGSVTLNSLSVGATGTIRVNIDAAAGTSTLYDVAGAATFATGATVDVRLANVSEAEGSYVFLHAGSLTGTPSLSTGGVAIPYMFNGSVTTDTTAGTARINIARKTIAQLGLNQSAAAAYDAIFAVLDADSAIADRYLAISDGDEFRQVVGRMLPDHAGGVFEAATSGSRTAARILADPNAPFMNMGKWGFWLQQVAWGSSKSLGNTASYDISGWGASGGAEYVTGAGNFGVSLGYFKSDDANGDNDNSVSVAQYELGAYWRVVRGPFNAYARASLARASFDSLRIFEAGDVTRKAAGDWNGWLYSSAFGAAYSVRAGRLTLRPSAALDYYRLNEKGYAETGGGDAFTLIVDGRDSDELAASGSLVAGYDLAGGNSEEGWFRVELEGGRRQILAGGLGATTARFGEGDAFTLSPAKRTDGWLGRLRLAGGGEGFTLTGEFSAEEQQSHVALAGRVGLSFAL